MPNAPKIDPVKLAKDINKLTRVPLPVVANILQKYPLDDKGTKKAYEECMKEAAKRMDEDLKKMFNL